MLNIRLHLRCHRVHYLFVSDLHFQMVLSLIHVALAALHINFGRNRLLIIGSLSFWTFLPSSLPVMPLLARTVS